MAFYKTSPLTARYIGSSVLQIASHKDICTIIIAENDHDRTLWEAICDKIDSYGV